MTAMSTSYLAIDVGGGSGRGIVGTLEGRRLTLREVHRFANYHVPVAGRDYWDLFHLFHEMIECVRRAQREHGDLSSFCVDLWGNDIAFLDKNGQPIGYPWCTRNSDGSAMEAFFRDVMPPEAYFMQCGSQVRRDMLRRVHEELGITVVLAEHRLDEAAALCSSLMLLQTANTI